MKDWVRDIAGRGRGGGRYSQGCQDGILGEIFRHVPTGNDPPFAVECGFNADSLVGGSGSNVARLVLEEGWRALLLDAGHENAAINLHREFLASNTVVAVLGRYGVPDEPDYVSIDLDSTDLWIFRAIVSRYRARVFSVEYNCHFPFGAAITFPDDPAETWEKDRGYGASLDALALVAVEHGYSLVAVAHGLDLFFVRNDFLEDGSGLPAPGLETWRGDTGCVTHPRLERPERAGMFLDYDVWRRTGGDVAAARRAALATSQRCLVSGGWRQRLRWWGRAVKEAMTARVC